MTDTNLAILLDRFVRRLHVALRRKAPDFDKANVGPGGAFILLTLEETGAVAMHELAKRLVRDKSQMTRAVRSLEAKGLVVRHACRTDSRVSLIDLSTTGQDFVATLQAVLAETTDELLVTLAEPDKQSLRKILETALSAQETEKDARESR